MSAALSSIKLDFQATRSRSCRGHHRQVTKLLQPFLNSLHDDLHLPRVSSEALTGKGGVLLSYDDDDAVAKYWQEFWNRFPEYWVNMKSLKNPNAVYAKQTLETLMHTCWAFIKDRVVQSPFFPVIERAHKPVCNHLQKLLKERLNEEKTALQPSNKEVYSQYELEFILHRSLWFNTEEFVDFFVFLTALLNLSSRASETSKLSIGNLSTGEVQSEITFDVLQCFLVRHKNGVDRKHPILPCRLTLFGDFPTAIGVALLMSSGARLMPSFASCNNVPDRYKKCIASLWKRYHPSKGEGVRQGASHWGKYTAQYRLDGFKLHKAAKLYAGHKPEEGARNSYFKNPEPYLLEGATALAGWTKKANGDYQPVVVPSFSGLEEEDRELALKICSAFFGHVPESSLGIQAKQMILVCLLSKWDQLVEAISTEPNGMFRDPSHHIIIKTVKDRMEASSIDMNAFDRIKTWCRDNLSMVNEQRDTAPPPPVKRVVLPAAANPEYATTLLQQNMNIRPLKSLLDLVTRNTPPGVLLVNYFALDYMGSFTSTPLVNNRSKCKYRKIKAAVRVMVRFSDKYPGITRPSHIELSAMMQRIKYALLIAGPADVKWNGQEPFSVNTPVSLTVIRENERILTDKSKPWYRPLPKDTPFKFIEHVYVGKNIYEV